MATLKPFLARGFLIAAVLAAGTVGLARAAVSGRLPASALVAGLTLLVAVDLWRRRCTVHPDGPTLDS